MNNRNTLATVGAAVAALITLSSSGAAAESHRCASIFDDAPRLACYDSTFGKPSRPAGSVAPAPAPSVAPPSAVQPAAKAKDQPVTGQIVAVGKLSSDRFAVTLDNGQLWMQLERDVAAEVRVGDTVTVRPAILGSWQLETRGGVKTRVKLAR